MESTPVAIGLHLCDNVIVEAHTGKISLVGMFMHLAMDNFPGVAPPFSVVATLTDGLGTGIITLAVTLLDTGEEIYRQEREFVFPEMLQEATYQARLRKFSFPSPGLYQFTLLVDGEWVAHRRLKVHHKR